MDASAASATATEKIGRGWMDELMSVRWATCNIVIRESVWSLIGGGDSHGMFCAATTGEFLIFFLFLFKDEVMSIFGHATHIDCLPFWLCHFDPDALISTFLDGHVSSIISRLLAKKKSIISRLAVAIRWKFIPNLNWHVQFTNQLGVSLFEIQNLNLKNVEGRWLQKSY